MFKNNLIFYDFRLNTAASRDFLEFYNYQFLDKFCYPSQSVTNNCPIHPHKPLADLEGEGGSPFCDQNFLKIDKT